jgi:hypothetical protein
MEYLKRREAKMRDTNGKVAHTKHWRDQSTLD